ncbi:LysR family transcriptional regulator [Paenibacillus aceti]|uniref:HTH lysR-type domain-containing protein n=1 Tax=Paenibacillus aceti TaxID=1820010 RepID=A0ABQ1VTK3_9BACL|nr:LysR family transcriptional regulator [Paenibacillus aceti]GGF94385.1 hypothetical protein GCM10010913_14870 [Paenibacillus aceti]
MNLEQLEYIVDVAKTKSLTKTAQHAHVTLSAVSQSISMLESELEVVLFHRSRGIGAVPTAEGQALIEIAGEIITLVKRLRDEAGNYSEKLSGELFIGTIPGPMHLLMELIADFKTDYPYVKVQIIEKGPKDILDELHSNQIDIGFIAMNERLINQNRMLRFERIFTGKMVVGVRADSPLALRKSIHPRELLKYTLVLYDDEYIRAYMTEFVAQFGELDILFISNNVPAIQKAVLGGLALTVGLDYSFKNKDFPTHIVPIELENSHPVYYGWVSSAQNQANPIIKRFIQRLKHA